MRLPANGAIRPLPWPADDERPGPACYCGRHGCIETFLSGPALARDGGGSDAAAVAARAEAGEAAALAALARYEDRLARGLATVINLLDPDVIVLGGGLGRIERLYRRVPLLWGAYVFSDRGGDPAGPAGLGRFERRARRGVAVGRRRSAVGRSA